MAYRRHSRDEILHAVVATAMDKGLGALTYGAVARRLGISDRMVVYYFPSKADLSTAVLRELSRQMQETVADAADEEPVPFEALLARAWPALATPASDRVFSLFFQVVGLASDGSEPYRSAVRALVMGWADWLEPRILAPAGCTRREAALAALARIDGLLLLRRTAGPRAANQAVRAMTLNCDPPCKSR
jgi:AcrR family transcriptional regulator